MRLPRTTLLALAALFACAVLAGPAQAVTVTVNQAAPDLADLNNGDGICDADQGLAGNQCTLRAAIQEAGASGDNEPSHTVVVPAGTYTLNLGPLGNGYNINIVGAGARSTIIQRSLEAPAARVFDFSFFTVNISGVTIRNGIADLNNGFFGGNIRSQNTTLNITNSTITGGSGSSGGGISNARGNLTLVGSTVAGNRADTGGGDGGAIQNFGDPNGAATLTLLNSTISGNSARLAGGIITGGHPNNAVTIRNSTIANNNSTLLPIRGGGGGLLVGSGTATVENSIVALNTSSSAGQENCSVDPGATLTSLGSNIESAAECGFQSPGDKQNTDPRIGPLQNAGGQTDTRPLLTGSPAIDAGKNASCLTTDQRGVTRPQGLVCDIGAYEVSVSPDTVIVAGPAAVTEDRTPTFTFSSTQPGTTFECAVDGGPFVACTSPFSLPELPAGEHTFQVRARASGGNVDTSPASFTFVIPAELRDLPAPVLGRSVNAEPVSGRVLVGVPAGAGTAARGGARASQKGIRFVPLEEAKQIPVGSFFNTRRGRVRLQSATTRRARRQAGVFTGGLFQTLQSRRRSGGGVFELRLKGSSFKNCTVKASRKASASRRSKRRIRRLSGNAKGRFRTRGRYSAATVRGTSWGVTDRCDGTLTRVFSGQVTVRDLRRKRNIRLRKGKRYLARAPG